jgi:hypothetical protein
MRSNGGRRFLTATDRVSLAAGSPASPFQQALDLGLDWAARSRAPVAMLVLQLSHLHAGPRPHHRRIAGNLLDQAARAHGGKVFACPNGDLMLLSDPATGSHLVATLSQLFEAESDGLLSVWSLPVDGAAARAHLANTPVQAIAAEDAPVPLGAIVAVGAALASTPVDQLVRRQTAVRISGHGMRPLYQELSVSFAALETQAGSPVPLVADPFLFRHLATHLDQRVLEAAAAVALAGRVPVHLNLTVPGILSPAFERLAATLPSGADLGVEVQFMEAVADLPRFAAACDRLRAAGCRLVVDGVDFALLSLARPAAWDPALLKLDWSPQMATLPGRERRLLSLSLTAFGPDRVVLHRAETEAALAWGRAVGITRFQGRHVDAMLAAERISVCRYAGGCTLRQCIDRAAATGSAGRQGCHDTALLDATPPTPAIVGPP